MMLEVRSRIVVHLAALLAAAQAEPAQAQSSVREFELGGSAHVVGPDCIRLTPDLPFLSGSAWFRRPVDLSRAFEVRLSLVLGEKDQAGADGIVFVLHPEPGTGYRGEGMGFAGLVPSLGVEFDTYRNLHLQDPEADHVALMADGESFHGRRGLGLVELPNLEDGSRHPLRITWEPEIQRLTVALDGKVLGTVPGAVLERIFEGQTRLFWGFTAATGRLSNDQDICLETFLSV